MVESSVTVHDRFAVLVYQPFVPSVPVIVGVIVGGVVSTRVLPPAGTVVVAPFWVTVTPLPARLSTNTLPPPASETFAVAPVGTSTVTPPTTMVVAPVSTSALMLPHVNTTVLLAKCGACRDHIPTRLRCPTRDQP